VKDAIKVLLTVLHYLMKFHKRQVLIKDGKLKIYLFAYLIVFGGESNCLSKTFVFLDNCNEEQKIDPWLVRCFSLFYM